MLEVSGGAATIHILHEPFRAGKATARMTTWQLLAAALAGLGGGLLSGFFGVGGNIVLVPLLSMTLGLTQLDAQGLTLAALLLPWTVRTLNVVHRAPASLQLSAPGPAVPQRLDSLVFDEEANRVAGFSLNVRPEECFLDRVPAEAIEGLLGPNAVLTVKPDTNLEVALEGHWSQPVELLPWLMILVLLLLAAECCLANRFYRRNPQEQEAEPMAAPRPSENGTNGAVGSAREAVTSGS